MPITEGTFDAAEFEAAVTANPALLDNVRPGLTKLGITPYTKAEYDAAMGVDLGKKTSEIHSAYDKDIKELTGQEKAGNEKTYEFLKRAVGGVLTERQNKITELETAIKSGSTDPTLKAQLESLQTKEKEWQKEKTTYGTTLFQKDVLLDLRLGQAGIKLSEALPKSIQTLALQNAEQKVLAMAKQQTVGDQTSIVYMENGSVVLGEDGQAADAAFLLRRELKDVLDNGQPGAGGGGGKGNPPKAGLDPQGNVIVPDALPADVKNQGDLMDYLVKLGVPKDTKQFDVAYGKFAEKLPLF